MPAIQVPNPKGGALRRFHVSADERYLAWGLEAIEAGQPGKWLLQDLRTAKLTDLANLLDLPPAQAKAASVEAFAPTGSLLLVKYYAPPENEQARRKAVYVVVNPETGKSREVHRDVEAHALWVGSMVAAQSQDLKLEVPQVKLVAPLDGKSEMLPLYGMIECSSADGGVFQAIADPDSPGTGVEWQAFREKARPVLMNRQGKVLKVFDRQMQHFQISPNGKWAAGWARTPDGPVTRLVEIDSGKETTFDGKQSPFRLCDDGALLTHGGTPGLNCLRAGRAMEAVVKGAGPCCVAGARIYYVSDEDSSKVLRREVPK